MINNDSTIYSYPTDVFVLSLEREQLQYQIEREKDGFSLSIIVPHTTRHKTEFLRAWHAVMLYRRVHNSNILP